MKTVDLINEMVSLPVEERARIAEAVLESLNPPDVGHARAWLAVAKRRLEELASGQVEGVPGEAVFERIRQRYAR
jgi:putative addiction module component (TIGR02574 family)